MTDSNSLQITSVNDLPGNHAAATFTITTKSSEVFKEAEEISPRHVSDKVSYMVSCFIFLRCKIRYLPSEVNYPIHISIVIFK